MPSRKDANRTIASNNAVLIIYVRIVPPLSYQFKYTNDKMNLLPENRVESNS
jgi:hypothetical protein